ncbi:MAG: peptidase S10 [Bacteroidetes bacterium]|nr:peptidase S10 [Bacteroidota bacterium]
MKNLLPLCGLFLLSFASFAQEKKIDKEWNAGPLSVTHHQLSTASGPMPYTATAGYMPMKDEQDSVRAKLFFVAYSKDGVHDPGKRPILFAFNGGPGSSSVWLHMGLMGPERVLMTDKGESIAPPYRSVANEYSWLDKADLVFIDPMLTGYTRPANHVAASDYTGYNKDLRFVADFIRMYLSRYNRWSSPKYVAGESYGTTRAAGLSNYLQDQYGIYLNGVVLISAVLSFNAHSSGRDNDLPYALQLPSYAAAAWYHGKADKKYQSLAQITADACHYATGPYLDALMKGDELSDAERKVVISKLHGLTGLSAKHLDECNLRLQVGRFDKELLRDSGKTIGRFDTRIEGVDYDRAGESPDYDPSYDRTVHGAYTAVFNDYVRRDLNFHSDLNYEILTGRVWPWRFSENGFLNVADQLRSAMVKNPNLQVWVCSGYFDLATPWFTTDYVLHHMFLPKELRKNLHSTYYDAGHMMYLHRASLQQLRKDFEAFMNESSSH